MKFIFISLLFFIHYVNTSKDGKFTDQLCFSSPLNTDDPTGWSADDVKGLGLIPGSIKQILNTTEKIFYCGKLYPRKGTRMIDENAEDPRVNQFRQNRNISWVEQEIRRVRVIKTADTEWNNLWHLNGDVSPSMKVSEAWNTGVNGTGILVAILDDGLQTDHPDFDANVNTLNDYDFVDGDNDPSHAGSDSHGTNVAGLIAAEINNNDCIVGVAYASTILGVKILGVTGLTDSEEANALQHHSPNVDIYSNSWGPTDGSGFSGPGTITNAALQNEVQNGRGGKGAIYTWAAGNGDTGDNCNADGYTNSIYTIGITSVEIGKNAWYSEVCAAAMAATYGGSSRDRYLTTTASSSNCVSTGMQGTSYSTPIASGIIALTLQANPALTWRDVQHLIVLTSTRNGFTDSYSDWSKNGMGKEYSQVLGFGLMNAEAMVSQARSWTLVPSQNTVTLSAQTGAGSTSGSTLSSQTKSVTSADCSTISYLEHVTVEVAFSWTRYRGATELYLVSPSGSESHLLHYRYDDAIAFSGAGSLTWTFMSVHFWRESPIGTWTLKFKSYRGYSTVTVTSWTLTFYGTATDPLPHIDLCTNTPCQNNGTCTNSAYSFSCTCTDDYTGTTCNTLISDSSSGEDNSLGIIIGGVCGAIVFVIILTIIICFKYKSVQRVAPQNSSPSQPNTILQHPSQPNTTYQHPSQPAIIHHHQLPPTITHLSLQHSTKTS